MRSFRILFLILVLPSFVGAAELVENGGFEDSFSPAWQEETVGVAASLTRATGHDADPDYEALASKGTGNGLAMLNQIIVIPSTDLDFTVNAKIQATATSGGPWAAAGVAVHYEDFFGNLLGSTMILGKSATCPWKDGDTVHLIPAPDADWNGYGFNLDDELVNLAGVDPLSIHQLRISLFGQTGGDC